MPHAVGRARSDYLTGWKEISSYLGVSPRTAQLWEKKYGLPVKRIGGSQGAVRVLVAELDEWRRRRAVEEDRVETEAEGAETVGGSRGRRRYVWAWFVAAAALLAVVGWTVRPKEFVVPPPDRVVEMPEVIHDPFSVSLSPDGRYAALVATLAGSDHPGLHVVDTETGELATLLKSGLRRYTLAWSPTGERIAYIAGWRMLSVIGSDGSDATQIAELPDGEIRGLEWRGDGGAILASVLAAGILEIDLATESVTPLLIHPHAEAAQYVEYGDRSGILFSAENGNPEGLFSPPTPHHLSLLDPSSGDVEELLTLAMLTPVMSYHRDGYVLHATGTPRRSRVSATAIGPAGSKSFSSHIVISNNGYGPTVSRNGTVAVLGGDDLTVDMLWVNRSGERIGRIGEDVFHIVLTPRLSPDGSRAILFGHAGPETGFWLVGPDEKRLLTPFSYRSLAVSAWSSDGQVVAHLMVKDSEQVVQFVRVDNPSERWSVPADGFLPEDWSADSEYLLGSQRIDDRWLLWIFPADGSNPGRAVLEAPGDHWDARWSPDERLMSYGRNLDGERHVFVRWADAPVDDPGVIVAEGRQPRWVKGGAELIYERGGVLYGVAIRTEGDQIVAGEPDQERFRLPKHTDKRMYDVAPDGERILVAHPPSENPRPFAIEVWSNLELP